MSLCSPLTLTQPICSIPDNPDQLDLNPRGWAYKHTDLGPQFLKLITDLRAASGLQSWVRREFSRMN